MSIPSLVLNNGVEIPQIGLGVFQVPAVDAQRLTEAAFEAGYRHVDTASAYGNEKGIGDAIRASGIRREELFITTKLWNADQGFESALAAFDVSRTLLGLDVLDLYLIHFPAPQRLAARDSWRALERVYSAGKVRAIGVSNFKFPYLDRLLAHAEVIPAVHQIEIHPTYQQPELDALSRRHGIVVEAYSPLGRGADLTAPTIVEIADRHGVSAAQVILNWHVSRGRVAIPKSKMIQRVRENLDVSGFVLADRELVAIEGLEAGLRTGEDVEIFS